MSMCQLVVLFIALLDTLICRLIISSCRMAIGTLAYWHIESLFLFLFFSIYSAEEFFNFHFTLQLHHSIIKCFRARRASRNVYIYRENFVYSVQYMIGFFERASAYGASTYGDHVFWVGHLIVQTFQYRSHFVGDCTAYHDHICLPWTGTGYFKPEAGHVVTRGTQCHEFDTATTGCESKWPQRITASPVDEVVQYSHKDVCTSLIEFLNQLLQRLIVDEFVIWD